MLFKDFPIVTCRAQNTSDDTEHSSKVVFLSGLDPEVKFEVHVCSRTSRKVSESKLCENLCPTNVIEERELHHRDPGPAVLHQRLASDFNIDRF